MAPLRVGYVREHFASPILMYAEEDQGKTFKLVECPGGTGQLIKAMEDDQVDVVIALTDALIAGIARGSDYKLVGSYVSTPLNWAVVTGKDSKYHSRRDLRGTTFGISRKGSGSELMVKLLAREEGWVSDPATRTIEEISYKICNNIDGLVESVNDGSSSAFLWEWFTTKPWADKGEVRFIGSVPTPWPSWMIAAHSSTTRCPRDDVITFVANLTRHVNEFDSESARKQKNVDFIKKHFGYPEEDIRAWMATVGYPTDCTKVDGSMIVKALLILEGTGVVTRPEGGFDPESFTNQNTTRTE